MPPVNRCEKCGNPMKHLKTQTWADMTEMYWECETCHEKYIVYPGRIPLRYRFFFAVLDILDHNEKDHVFYHLLGLEFRACARCLGVYIAGLICFIVFGYMYFMNVQLPFYPVLIISMVFGGLTLIDYATVEIFHVRRGSNRVRVITGVFLGVGAMLYFWLLPIDWWFRMITLLFYNLLALLVAYISMRTRSDGEAQAGIVQ
jgi:uncharacterized membrane protein